MQQVYEFARFVHDTVRLLLFRKAALICCLAAFSISCGHSDQQTVAGSPEASPQRVLKRGLPGEPRTLDPQVADDTFSLQVLRDLYEGLTAIDRHGDVVPGIASSWSVDSSGTRYTFKIRPEAKWSDGHSVIASEFVSGLRRAVDPKTASGSGQLLSLIRNATDIAAKRKATDELRVSAPDDWTVLVELERPAPYILQILAEPVAAPLHLHGGNTPVVDPKITEGPYVMESRVVGSFIVINKNSNYWNAHEVPVSSVRYVTVESEATEVRQYLADQLDLTYTVPEADLQRLAREHGNELQKSPVLGTLYLALDLTEPPFRNAKDLREALSIAIDRQAITDNLTVGATPAYSFVAKGTNNYQQQPYDWSTLPREKQVDRARELFARAGYSKSRPLTLTLYLNSGESNQRIMTAVAGQWRDILGVETTLLSEEFRVFLGSRKDHKKWDVVRLGWWADYNDASSFLEIFATNGVQNDPEYDSKEFNRLIDAARIDADARIRGSTLQEAERTLLGDYPIVPVYFYGATRLAKPSIGGAEISPLNRTYSKHLFWR